MTKRLVINTNERSLIDCAKPSTPPPAPPPPTPPNKLLSIRVTAKGDLRFRFRDRVLPKWFFNLARRLDYAMIDNAPTQLRGRTVGLVDNRKDNPDFEQTRGKIK